MTAELCRSRTSFDFQRRCNELNIDKPMPLTDENEAWFEKTLAEHATKHPHSFTVINIDEDDNVISVTHNLHGRSQELRILGFSECQLGRR